LWRAQRPAKESRLSLFGAGRQRAAVSVGALRRAASECCRHARWLSVGRPRRAGVSGGKPEDSFWRYAAGDDASAPGPRNFTRTQQDPFNTTARAGAGRSERGPPEREAPSVAGGTDPNVPIIFD